MVCNSDQSLRRVHQNYFVSGARRYSRNRPLLALKKIPDVKIL